MNETRKRLIVDLLERYKEKFLNVSLAGPYKEGERANEIYKWQLITNCSGNSEAEIVEKFKDENVIDRAHDRIVLLDLLENQRQQVGEAFAILEHENVSLIDRLSEFKATMAALCDKKYKSKADDERTASAFLACWNPQKYTFYMNGLYKNYCEYIGEQPRAVGEKYPHYLQLLPELIEIIKQDAELMSKFRNETNGLIQSDLLIAQTILWQMRDIINSDENIVNDSFLFKEFLNAIKSLLYNNESFSLNNNKGKDFVWINALHNFMATDECHYEFCADNTKKAGHDGKHIFVEVHFEGSNHLTFENALINTNGLVSFKWSKFGFRINDNGFELKGDVDDVAKKAINELYKLDNLIGQTIKQIINNMKRYTEIEKITQLLNLKRNIILQGAPGTGKTYNTAALALSICGEAIPETHEDVLKRYEELRKEGRIGFCTFHQSMDYEDFVEGIKPKTTNGHITCEVEPGIFKTMCKNAINKDSENFVLIIDEINRGNVSKIFVELITLLEADKRLGGEHPIKVTLPYSKESFGVPSNLYIIGTMNTTDRSVGNIDYAVRRRFAFVTLESKEEVIEEYYRNDESLKNKALGLFNSVKAFLIKHKFDMDIADLMVGHSYFLAKDEEELGLKWKYEIVPLLHEYYKDGITKQDVKADTSIDDFCNSK